jgi:hypothetical protein
LMRGCAVRVFILVCSVLLASVTAAEAGSCRRAIDPNNPMVSNADYGVTRCRARRDRADPMVWSDAQWRSSLFGGYAQTYNDRYDRRFRRDEHARGAIVRIERNVVMNDEAAPKTKLRRAKFIGVRGQADPKAGRGVLRFDGHRCRGVLVLTWGTLGAKSRCYHNGGRIKTL